MKPVALVTCRNLSELDPQSVGDHAHICLADADGDGAQKMRNLLMAEAAPYEAWRMLDCPDDRLAFGMIDLRLDDDLIWFGYRTVQGDVWRDVTFSGDPVRALFEGMAPWNFIARTEAIRAAGIRWDESAPCRHGSWFWLQALRAGLRFRYVPCIGYVHNRRQSAISNAGAFRTESRKVFTSAWEWIKRGPDAAEYQSEAEQAIVRWSP